MKIYTRTGDAGATHLVGGKKVQKDDARIEAYGTVDELNSVLGVTLEHVQDHEIRDILKVIQFELFDLGAELANPKFARDPAKPQACVDDAMIERMERQIDKASAECPELMYFVLPGGSPTSAYLHLARTVCRRAERCVVTLAGVAPAARRKAGRAAKAKPGAVRGEAIRYLNRLSDLLFALSRLANVRAGVTDVPWKPPDGRPVFHVK